jgi:hypothetical protein
MTVNGLRTLIAFLASLVVMLTGFWLLPSDARGAAFVFFAGGIGALMAAIAGKASIDALAQGGGIGGAKAALMTSAKPGAPPEPPAPEVP